MIQPAVRVLVHRSLGFDVNNSVCPMVWITSSSNGSSIHQPSHPTWILMLGTDDLILQGAAKTKKKKGATIFGVCKAVGKEPTFSLYFTWPKYLKPTYTTMSMPLHMVTRAKKLKLPVSQGTGWIRHSLTERSSNPCQCLAPFEPQSSVNDSCMHNKLLGPPPQLPQKEKNTMS